MAKDYLTANELTLHLNKLSGAQQALKVDSLDINVYRIFYATSSSMARVFPYESSHSHISYIASLLSYLESQSFPAERLDASHGPALSKLDIPGKPGTVLLTRFIHGGPPERGKASLYKIGMLLGKLHGFPVPEDAQSGGAWHHLCLGGGAEEECEAALGMLAEKRAEKAPTAEDARAIEYLTKTIAEMRVLSASLAELPRTLIHPDPVHINIIATSETDWTLIDWAGAGLGLRVFALGWLLVASYMRSGGKIGVVDVILKGYHRMKAPVITNEEVDTLGKMAGLRMANIRAWEVGVGKKAARDVLKEVQMWFEAGQLVGNRVREVLAKPRAMEEA